MKHTLSPLGKWLLILLGIEILVVAVVGGQPLPRIDFTPGCAQVVPGSSWNAMAYTDDVALWPFQWGFLGGSAATGQQHSRNGVGKTGLGFCPPAVAITGDCWQSVTTIIATPGTKKWVIAAGGPYMCGGEGLQVWKWNGSTFAWWGLIKSPTRPLAQVQTNLSLVGDEAWGRNRIDSKFTRYDLNAKSVVSVDNPAAPPFTPQPNVQGFTYRLFPVHPNPIPVPYGGAKVFYALRSDVQGPTATPAPPSTPSRTATAGAPGPTRTKTKTATPGPIGGCPPGVPCQCCNTQGCITCPTKTPTRTPSTTRTSPSFSRTPSPAPASATPSRTPTASSSLTPTIAPSRSSTPTAAPTVTPGNSGGGCRGKAASGSTLAGLLVGGVLIALRRRRS